MSNVDKAALELHKENQGKLEIVSKVDLGSSKDLTLAYTPGVAAPCLEIKEDYNKIYDYTTKSNMVAVVTNGTAVLGLGNIGAGAGLPVMEGKAVLFKSFAGVDAVPLCLNSRNVDDICHTVEMLEPGFGGINLEDIKAPECFDIENRLKETMNIPVFHDDQHGTAIVVAAALINALKVVKKEIGDVKVVINGAGSAGTAIGLHLLRLGVKNLVMVDRFGIICKGDETLSPAHKELAEITNPNLEKGVLSDAMKGADVFIGVSAPNIVSTEMVKSMADSAIMFPMANPVPEIMPDLAEKAGAAVVGTGRSDFKNQINNVLAFPGIFRGALDVRASDINEEMKLAASKAIASLVSDDELSADYIIPKAFDRRVGEAVAKAVAQAARDTGVARI